MPNAQRARPDCAKWKPEVLASISLYSAPARAHVGIDHLGIQVEDAAEQREVYERLLATAAPVLEQGAATRCDYCWRTKVSVLIPAPNDALVRALARDIEIHCAPLPPP
jgi:hypothetical protein